MQNPPRCVMSPDTELPGRAQGHSLQRFPSSCSTNHLRWSCSLPAGLWVGLSPHQSSTDRELSQPNLKTRTFPSRHPTLGRPLGLSFYLTRTMTLERRMEPGIIAGALFLHDFYDFQDSFFTANPQLPSLNICALGKAILADDWQ